MIHLTHVEAKLINAVQTLKVAVNLLRARLCNPIVPIVNMRFILYAHGAIVALDKLLSIMEHWIPRRLSSSMNAEKVNTFRHAFC